MIPLARLGLAATTNRWLMEFQLTTHDAKGKNIHATRFGSTRAYDTNARFGLFEVEP